MALLLCIVVVNLLLCAIVPRQAFLEHRNEKEKEGKHVGSENIPCIN